MRKYSFLDSCPTEISHKDRPCKLLYIYIYIYFFFFSSHYHKILHSIPQAKTHGGQQIIGQHNLNILGPQSCWKNQEMSWTFVYFFVSFVGA